MAIDVLFLGTEWEETKHRGSVEGRFGTSHPASYGPRRGYRSCEQTSEGRSGFGSIAF